jgi:hypothetical protein
MLLQEWASDAQTLSLFANHYQTGAAIPSELVQKLRDSREFGKALYTRRQMFLSALSLELHNRAPGFDATELAFQLQEKYVPFRRELVPGAYFHLSLGHLLHLCLVGGDREGPAYRVPAERDVGPGVRTTSPGRDSRAWGLKGSSAFGAGLPGSRLQLQGIRELVEPRLIALSSKF